MVKKLSDTKLSKIFRLYFQGFTQTEIASKLGITQASVSIHVSQFKFLAKQQGIMAAAKEYGIMDQVASLYDLAVDLKKAKTTVEGAKSGLKTSLLLQECGVEEEEYGDLTKACKKLSDEGFLSAAMELSQLEDSTGMFYEEVVNKYKSTSNQLSQAQKQLQDVKSKMASSHEELKKINKQKNTGSQELKAHMAQIGVDMQRLKKVEALALVLKKADVPNQELPVYIERQQSLNKAGIGIDMFGNILDRSKVATMGDNGNHLLNLLEECGSLNETIYKQQAKKQVLEDKISDLEIQSKLKDKLEGEVKKLKSDKAGLEADVAGIQKKRKDCNAQLQQQQNDWNQLAGEFHSLRTDYLQLEAVKGNLEYVINNKEAYDNSLDKEIEAKEQKLSNLSELESKHDQLTKENDELETRVNKEKLRLNVFDSFVGLVQANSVEDVLKNTGLLLINLKKLEPGKHSPELLKQLILKDLAGPELQILKCTECQARFCVDKKPHHDHYQCPVGHLLHFSTVTVDKDAAEILKEALPKVPRKIQVFGKTFEMIEPENKGK